MQDDLILDPSEKSKAESFQKSIKEKTAALHSLLESIPLLTAIISLGVTTHEYYIYLFLMEKIIGIYERDVLPLVQGIVPGPGQQPGSLQLIRMDLQKFDYIHLKEVTIRDYEIPPGDLTIPFALGFMYVMEGSKLGGKVILKHINRCLGFTEHSGAAYISDYGADTAGHWKKFLILLSRYAVENNCEEEIIKGSIFAFSFVHRYFASNSIVYEA